MHGKICPRSENDGLSNNFECWMGLVYSKQLKWYLFVNLPLEGYGVYQE